MLDKLQKYLAQQATPVGYEELLAQVLPGKGNDAGFGRAFLRRLLAEDPRFLEDDEDGAWGLAESHLLEVLLAEAPLVVVDLETTGQSAEETGLTEIGAIRMVGLSEVGRFDRLINPGRPIPNYVSKLTGISNKMVADAPSVESIIGEFVEFAADAVIVAHNAAFDVQVLDHVCRRVLGRPLGLPALCTFKLSRRLLPNVDKASLDGLGKHFGLAADPNRHRAMADCELTVEVLRRLMPLVEGLGVTTIGDLLAAQEDPEVSRRLEIRVTRNCLEGLSEGPGVYWLIGSNGRTLFVGSAANVRHQVCSYFMATTHMSSRQLKMISSTVDVGFRPTLSQLEMQLAESEEVRRRKPEYNRNDRHLPRGFYVKLLRRGQVPRVMVASKMARDGDLYLGPIRGRAFADEACRALAKLYRLPFKLEGEIPDGDANDLKERALDLEKALRAGKPRSYDGAGDRGEAVPDETRRAMGAISRLLKLHRRRHWLVNCHSYMVAIPAAGPALLVYLIINGYCRVSARLERLPDVRRFVEEAGVAARLSERVNMVQADASTIFSHWIRRPREDDEAVVFDIATDRLEESLKSAAVDLRAIVESFGPS